MKYRKGFTFEVVGNNLYGTMNGTVDKLFGEPVYSVSFYEKFGGAHYATYMVCESTITDNIKNKGYKEV